MKLRRLTDGEAALAADVFGEGLTTATLWLVEGAPTFGWAMVIGRLMLFPVRVADFAAEDVGRRAWFVHELTHAWQFQHWPVRTMVSWARTSLSGGYLTGAAYRVPSPFDWEHLNLAQQARAVEQAYLMRCNPTPETDLTSRQPVIDAWRSGGSALEALSGRPTHDPRHR